MPAIVSKRVLVDALDRVRPTVSTNKMMEILSHFCFKNGLVSTSNGNAGTATNVDVADMEFCVNADKFYRIINSMFDEITLSMNGGELNLRSAGSKMKIATVPVRNFPDVIPGTSERLPVSTDLLKAVKKVQFTISSNANRVSLMGAGLLGNYAYSSTGERITRAPFTIATPISTPVTIPSDSIKHLLKLGEPTYFFTVGVDANSFGCFYEDTKTVYVTRCLGQKFPYDTTDQLISRGKFNEQYSVRFPDQLADAVSRALLIVDAERENKITVENVSGVLKITAVASDGSSEEEIFWEYKTPFKFSVNPEKFLEALKCTDQVDLENVITGDKQCLFFKDSEHMIHILALMV